MCGTIYIIKEHDNVVYVGETVDYRNRSRGHYTNSKLEKYKSAIYQYIRHRGGWEKGGFTIEKIEELESYKYNDKETKAILRNIESKYIKYYSDKYILLNGEISRYMYMWWTQNDNKNNLQYETRIKYITNKNNKKIKIKIKKYNKFYFDERTFKTGVNFLDNYHNISTKLAFDHDKAGHKLSSDLIKYKEFYKEQNILREYMYLLFFIL